MLRIILAGVRGHLVRFLLTALAVTLGVSFATGTLVFRDTMGGTLDAILDSRTVNVDVVVRSAAVPNQAQGGPMGRPAQVPLSVVDPIRAIPGVATAWASVQGPAFIAGKNGTAVRSGGAPGLGFSYLPDAGTMRIITGRAPASGGEIAVERATLERAELQVGDRTTLVAGNQNRQVTIVGVVDFGSLFGATGVFLDDASAVSAFAPNQLVSTVGVRLNQGADRAQVERDIRTKVPAGTEAVSSDAVRAEYRERANTGLGFVTVFLMVFALIAVFVGSFIIFNTFSMVTASRSRDVALLRAVGMSRAQVWRMLLGEAVVVGLVGSALGVAGGVGVAGLIQGLLRRFAQVNLGALVLSPRTVVVGVVLGVMVTLVSAMIPAWRAARIAPVALLRSPEAASSRALRWWAVLGVLGLVATTAALVWAVQGGSTPWLLVGAATGVLLLSVLLVSPALVGPVTTVISWPIRRLTHMSARLAQRNAARMPRRTSLTASMVTIGAALVVAVAVAASSVKASISDATANEISADYVISAGGVGAVPPVLESAVAATPQVQTTAVVEQARITVNNNGPFALAAQPQALADTMNITMQSGSLASMRDATVLVSRKYADEQHLTLGQQFTATVGTVTNQRLTVGGVYSDLNIWQNALFINKNLYDRLVPEQNRETMMILVRADPGADLVSMRNRLATAAKPYLVVSVESRAQFVSSINGQVDVLLAIVYGLLLLSIVMAMLGVINTLALSIMERVREIGLVRAVGMRRAQVARMVTWEAIMMTFFGALLGVLLGLGLGVLLVRGLRHDGITALTIPFSTVGTVAVAAIVGGVLAAVLPAIRAIRINTLQAIQHD